MNRIMMIGAAALLACAGALFPQADRAAAQAATEQTEAEQTATEQNEAERPATEQSQAEQTATEQTEAEQTATEQTQTEQTATEQTEVEENAEDKTNAAPDSVSEAVPNEAGIYEMTLGPADARVTVTEYASFTCPHCATFHKTTFKQLKADYIDTGKVQFIYRDVYFDRPGLWAAMVARCDGPQRFFGITGMLFDQQRDWASGNDPVAIANKLRKIGKVAGLSEDKLEGCLTDADKAAALYAWFEANAEADDIKSTPSLVINGETYGNMSYADLAEILEKELAE